MAALRPDIDPQGLLEYSVVFTDRSLNHMSQRFQGVMRGLSDELKTVYNAAALALVPGGGTFAMEATARQIANGKKVMIIRNGWFSYRWSQINAAGDLADEEIVIPAQRQGNGDQAPFAPAPIEEVEARIAAEKPDVVFAPHVETSAGVILPDEYIRRVGAAAQSAGGLFVLDCIASGCIWVDMGACNVDMLISAPQKGWSSTPCAGVVMMSARGRDAVKSTKSSSFACDLGKWLDMMEAYENGGHAYHATMPTDGIQQFYEAVLETKARGYDNVKAAQSTLGEKVRALLAEHGFTSVAAEGYGAPGVVVSYTDDPAVKNGSKFAAQGMQIAAGVPLQVGEGAAFSTFRIGLFGLDKLDDVDSAVARLADAITSVRNAA